MKQFDPSKYTRVENYRTHKDLVVVSRFRDNETNKLLFMTRFLADQNGDPENDGFAKGSLVGVANDMFASFFDLLSQTREYYDKLEKASITAALSITAQYDRVFPGDVWMSIDDSVKRMANEIEALRSSSVLSSFSSEKRHIIYSALRAFQKTGVYSSPDEENLGEMLDELVDWAYEL